MTEKLIQRGFIIAGLSNILGVIICSKAFTNDVMLETQPDVMGHFGLISIVLWGFAYISVSKIYNQARWLVGFLLLKNWLCNCMVVVRNLSFLEFYLQAGCPCGGVLYDLWNQ